MYWTIRKKFKFEMAHILTTAFSKECQNIHGHSYILEIKIQATQLNSDGMVIDFKRLKEIIKVEIIDKFDHAFVIEDPQGVGNKAFPRLFYEYAQFFHQHSKGMKIVLVPYNPTAENMAQNFYYRIFRSIRKEVDSLTKLTVRLHETSTGYAEYGGTHA